MAVLELVIVCPPNSPLISEASPQSLTSQLTSETFQSNLQLTRVISLFPIL